jgi:hypothetical protein
VMRLGTSSLFDVMEFLVEVLRDTLEELSFLLQGLL